MSIPVCAWINAVLPDARMRLVAAKSYPRIVLPKMTDAWVAMTVRYPDNRRVDLTYSQLVLTVAPTKAMAEASIAVAGDLLATDGDVMFSIVRADSAGLALGVYYYTVEAVWSDGTRAQLVPVTEMALVASAPTNVSVGGTYRALRVGLVQFSGETEKAITLDPAISGSYVVLPTVEAASDVAIPDASIVDASSAGFTISLSGPYTGRVTYAIYPA